MKNKNRLDRIIDKVTSRFPTMSHILDKPLELERLASLTLHMIDDKSQPLVSRSLEGLESSFREALPKAYRLLQVAEEFLEEKEVEKEAEGKRYWESPEGKKRREETIARFNKLKKKSKGES
jgi:hypothetical protein